MRRWDNIIQMPMTQYDRFYRMVRLLNDVNDSYSGDLLIPDETGKILVNVNANNGRASTGYSRSVIAVIRDSPHGGDRINEEIHQEHNDIRLAQVAMGTKFNRLSQNERILMLRRYFNLKGMDKLLPVPLERRQTFNVIRYAEFHLIVEWGLNLYNTEGFMRGYAVEAENDAFYLEGKITEDKAQLGEPKRIRTGKENGGETPPEQKSG